MCCDKFVEDLKDEVRESTSVQDVVQPSNARKNVVCFGCLNRVIKTRIRDKEANSNSPAEKSRVKKRARTLAMEIQVCLTSSVSCVNIHANMQTNIRTKRVEHACCCCAVTNCVSTCISYEEHVCLWGHCTCVWWNGLQESGS